jgi:peptidoglycan/xylan/chitin deacetylase (PgdA/CDA1 family)
VSITRGEFLRSLGKSLPGLVASTGVATAAEALFRRIAQATDAPPPPPPRTPKPAQETIPFLSCGPLDSPGVALTFDDGPTPGITERLLDTLRAHDARATFFLIGEKVAAAPELARRVMDEGHEIGHHTYTHRKLTELSDADVDRELDQTQAIFEEVLGHRATWLRPPFGALRQDQARRARERGLAVVLWSVDAEDWRDPSADSVAERVRTHLDPGAIVLSHEVASTADSLDATLQDIHRSTAFQLLTLSELVTTRK